MSYWAQRDKKKQFLAPELRRASWNLNWIYWWGTRDIKNADFPIWKADLIPSWQARKRFDWARCKSMYASSHKRSYVPRIPQGRTRALLRFPGSQKRKYGLDIAAYERHKMRASRPLSLFYPSPFFYFILNRQVKSKLTTILKVGSHKRRENVQVELNNRYHFLVVATYGFKYNTSLLGRGLELDGVWEERVSHTQRLENKIK